MGLSIDDFGTGYSSLSYLKRLPIEEIKVDRSFVMQMHVDANDFMIVRATVELGRNLGLRVVAEGVEDLDTFDRLAEFGCDEAQGYYISRPSLPRSSRAGSRSGTWSERRRSALAAWSTASRRPAGSTSSDRGPPLRTA